MMISPSANPHKRQEIITRTKQRTTSRRTHLCRSRNGLQVTALSKNRAWKRPICVTTMGQNRGQKNHRQRAQMTMTTTGFSRSVVPQQLLAMRQTRMEVMMREPLALKSSSSSLTAVISGRRSRRGTRGRTQILLEAKDDDDDDVDDDEYFEDDDDESDEVANDDEEDDDEENEENDDENEEYIEENVGRLRDTFEAAGIEDAKWIDLDEEEDVEITGIVSDARYALEGDLFICVDNSDDKLDPHDGHNEVEDAIKLRRAVAVVSEREKGVVENANGAPVVIVKSTKDILGKLGKAFYDDPSGKLIVAGVFGHRGKDTTCNLIKEIFEASKEEILKTSGYRLKREGTDSKNDADDDDDDEDDDNVEVENRAGVITSSGYFVTPSILPEDMDELEHACSECGQKCVPADERITQEREGGSIFCRGCEASELFLDPIIPNMKITQHGGAWRAEEPDLNKDRACSAPGWLAPYQGKYEIPEKAPDALQNQQILAGMVDAGACAVAMEISDESLVKGHINNIDFDILVFTNSPRMAALNNDNKKDKAAASTSDASSDEENEDDVGIDDIVKQGKVEKEEKVNDDEGDDDGEYETSYESNLSEEEVQNWRERALTLVSSLNDKQRQRVVVNLDDEFAADIIANCKVPVILYARKPEHKDMADVFCESAELSLYETAIKVYMKNLDKEEEIVTALVGDANISNVLASIACGFASEIDIESIAEGLSRANSIPGRMQLVDEGQKFCTLVDSAKTPEDVRNAIQSARAITQCRRVIVVVGADGTNHDYTVMDSAPEKEFRRKMGETVDKYADVVFVSTQSPKNEDCYDLLDDVVEGFRSRVYGLRAVQLRLPDGIIADIPFMQDMYLLHPNAQAEAVELQNMVKRFVIVDRFFAIRAAIGLAEDNDCVLILGRGDQDFFELEGQKYWFDDVMEARDCLIRIKSLHAEGVVTTSLPWYRVEQGRFHGNILGLVE